MHKILEFSYDQLQVEDTGGLAATTRLMINAIEMLENDITIVETVGARQGDVGPAIADTIVVEVD